MNGGSRFWAVRPQSGIAPVMTCLADGRALFLPFHLVMSICSSSVANVGVGWDGPALARPI